MRLQLDLVDGSTVIFDNSKLNLKRVLHGDERPDIGWLQPNIGSFDIVPICPDARMLKGDPVKLTLQHMDVILSLNPDSNGWTRQEKINWLTSNEGRNDMFLAMDEVGNWRIPSPGVCGGAIVNVLWEKNNMSAIQCLDMSNPLPTTFPEHLAFQWYGIGMRASEGDLYHWLARGGIITPVMFSSTFGYIPTAWTKSI